MHVSQLEIVTKLVLDIISKLISEDVYSMTHATLEQTEIRFELYLDLIVL